MQQGSINESAKKELCDSYCKVSTVFEGKQTLIRNRVDKANSINNHPQKKNFILQCIFQAKNEQITQNYPMYLNDTLQCILCNYIEVVIGSKEWIQVGNQSIKLCDIVQEKLCAVHLEMTLQHVLYSEQRIQEIQERLRTMRRDNKQIELPPFLVDKIIGYASQGLNFSDISRGELYQTYVPVNQDIDICLDKQFMYLDTEFTYTIFYVTQRFHNITEQQLLEIRAQLKETNVVGLSTKANQNLEAYLVKPHNIEPYKQDIIGQAALLVQQNRQYYLIFNTQNAKEKFPQFTFEDMQWKFNKDIINQLAQRVPRNISHSLMPRQICYLTSGNELTRLTIQYSTENLPNQEQQT